MCFRTIKRVFWMIFAHFAIFALSSPASAANCAYATSQGSTGPSNWQTYCWLDFSGFRDATARQASGQNFSYTLTDGTVMTFNLKVTGSSLVGSASPSWSGAAIGNTAFMGISGKPILYQTAAGTTSITISAITLTPPTSGSIANYMLVAADGESSNQGESLQFQTNGGSWQMLDQAGPISGASYPTYSGIGSTTFLENGAAGYVGAYVVGSTNPGQVVSTLVGGGLQGVMFAVRFASIRLNTQISQARADPADQFNFAIKATGSGSNMASGTTSGASLGPFVAAALSSTAAIPLTLSQTMAPGSVSTISHYRSSLTCTNAVGGSSTTLPVGVLTTSYSFGALQFGDNVSCSFTETPYPHLRLAKSLAASGRQFAADQFVMNIKAGSAVVATATTTGTGATVTTGTTPQFQGTPGVVYSFSEAGEGSTSLTQYTSSMSCSNAAASSTTSLPAAPGGVVTPQMGDVINCTILNTKRATNATLVASKASLASSDPVNGTTNPKAIPGAVILYSITVQNTGPNPVDTNSVFIIDSLPPQIAVGSAAAPSLTQGTTSSGLTFTPSTDVRYSNAGSAPSNFASCTYSPVAAYDPAIKFVCINPKGAMAGSSGSPPSFTVSFRTQIQ